MGESLNQKVLNDLVESSKKSLRRHIVRVWNESTNLAGVLEGLPNVLRLVLKPIQKNLYFFPDYVSNLPESPVSDKRNADTLSELFAYVDGFINDGLFTNMNQGDNKFRPMDLEYSLKILDDVETFVEMMYEANRERIANLNCGTFERVNPFSGSGLKKNFEGYFPDYKTEERSSMGRPLYRMGDPAGRTKALIPARDSIKELKPFFERYKIIKQFEYVSAFRNHRQLIYETLAGSPLQFDKALTAISHYHDLFPDVLFTRNFVLPNLRKTENQLEKEFPIDFILRFQPGRRE